MSKHLNHLAVCPNVRPYLWQHGNPTTTIRTSGLDAVAARKPDGRSGTTVALTPLTKQVIGANVTAHDERNGYWFWGLVAAFIGIPELLAGFSKTLKADIPWPTI